MSPGEVASLTASVSSVIASDVPLGLELVSPLVLLIRVLVGDAAVTAVNDVRLVRADVIVDGESIDDRLRRRPTAAVVAVDAATDDSCLLALMNSSANAKNTP